MTGYMAFENLEALRLSTELYSWKYDGVGRLRGLIIVPKVGTYIRDY